MSKAFFSSDYFVDSETGHFLSGKHKRVAEIINDWNPQLFLCYVPYSDRTPGDNKPPFAVIHKQSDGNEYVVLTCEEEEVDERLIARLWSLDQSRPENEVNITLDAMAAAEEAMRLKKIMEQRAEMHDVAGSVFRSPLHTYRLTKTKVIKS